MILVVNSSGRAVHRGAFLACATVFAFCWQNSYFGWKATSEFSRPSPMKTPGIFSIEEMHWVSEFHIKVKVNSRPYVRPLRRIVATIKTNPGQCRPKTQTSTRCQKSCPKTGLRHYSPASLHSGTAAIPAINPLYFPFRLFYHFHSPVPQCKANCQFLSSLLKVLVNIPCMAESNGCAAITTCWYDLLSPRGPF